MKKNLFLSMLCIISFTGFVHSEAVPASAPAAAPSRAVRPRGVVLPPEAFTTPTNYILVVNLNNSLDAEWLDNECRYMQKQLNVRVEAQNVQAEVGADPRPFIDAIRKEHDGRAKIVIAVSEESGLAPILAAPNDNWVVMDAGWVKRGGGDEEKINYRMERRIFQALGHCIGAGYRMERESVMRYTPVPEALDDCLSHGFHPLNSNIFLVVAKGIGLELVSLRPRKELIEMGVLKPAQKKQTKD